MTADLAHCESQPTSVVLHLRSHCGFTSLYLNWTHSSSGSKSTCPSQRPRNWGRICTRHSLCTRNIVSWRQKSLATSPWLTAHLHLARPSLSRPTPRPSRYRPTLSSHEQVRLSCWTQCGLQVIFTVHMVMGTELFWFRSQASPWAVCFGHWEVAKTRSSCQMVCFTRSAMYSPIRIPQLASGTVWVTESSFVTLYTPIFCATSSNPGTCSKRLLLSQENSS